jgi:hypothetical protein
MSLYTATVLIPIFLAVRMTRHAISPLLAMSNLWIYDILFLVYNIMINHMKYIHIMLIFH